MPGGVQANTDSKAGAMGRNSRERTELSVFSVLRTRFLHSRVGLLAPRPWERSCAVVASLAFKSVGRAKNG